MSPDQMPIFFSIQKNPNYFCKMIFCPNADVKVLIIVRRASIARLSRETSTDGPGELLDSRMKFTDLKSDFRNFQKILQFLTISYSFCEKYVCEKTDNRKSAHQKFL